MKRLLRFLIIAIIALLAVSLLPFYLVPRMTRMQMSAGGDVINWGMGLVSLHGYLSDYQYMSPETSPLFWLVVNSALAIIYSLLIAIAIDRLIIRSRRTTA